MPRLREMLVVCLYTGWLLASSTLLHAQPAPPKPGADVQVSPLLIEPKTPEETFAAALLMVDLARLDLAQKYLEKFAADAPDDDLLVKLRSKHGTGEFLKLSRIKELQPLSIQLLQQLNAASRKQSENPEFIDGLVAKLSGTPVERELAMIELRNAGPRAVPQILRLMRQPDLQPQQDAIVIALTRMGRQVVPPLLGALDAPEERIRAALIGVLASLDAKEAIPYLWYPAFAEDEPLGIRIAASQALAKLITGSSQRTDRLTSVVASSELRRLAKSLFDNPAQLPLNDSGSVTIWGWDDKENSLVPQSYSPQIAAMLLSTRFARQSLTLSPDLPEPQRQYLASLLGLEVLQQGWDKPRESVPGTAMYLAVTSGEETVARVLADALAASQPSTAVAALDVLSQIGTREQLIGSKGLKSPVLAALNAPDPRVQFAAANTILRIEPKTGFSGANRVVGILARALSDPGKGQAVIIDADGGRGSQAAGFLDDYGYEPIVAKTGREGFELAATNAGVEVALIHANCIRWDLTQTVANFRADSRTAAIPIVIYGTEDTRESVQRLILRSKPATFIAESGSTTDFKLQFDPFVHSVKSPPLSAQERNQQKISAAYWLAAIVTGRGTQVFDVSQAEKDLSIVVESPDVGVNALVALGGISSRTSQRRLFEAATNPQLDPVLRQTAALQLGYHIQRFSLLLTKDEIGQVQQSWTSTEDPAVKSALAGVIGTLRPNPTLIGERLRQFPTPGRTP